MHTVAPTLPPEITVLERGWLSANNIVFIGEQSGTTVVDTGYGSHAAQTVALVASTETAETMNALGPEEALAAERNGRQRRGAVRYGSSTALIAWTIPFDAEMSVAAMPAAESAARVSVPPFSMW